MDGGAWWATAHRFAKSQTRLNSDHIPLKNLILQNEVITPIVQMKKLRLVCPRSLETDSD